MKLTNFLLIGFLFIFLSCNDDEGDNNSDNFSIDISIDGEATEETNIVAALTDTNINGAFRTLGISGKLDGNDFSLLISNPLSLNPPTDGIEIKQYAGGLVTGSEADPDYVECHVDGIVATCEHAQLLYSDGTNSYVSTLYMGDLESSVTITACNPSTKKVSGTINIIIGVDFFDPTNVIQFTGAFTDIPYTVQ